MNKKTLSHGRVLYVDDNVQMLHVLKMGLTHHGFEVITAFDGADAAYQFLAHEGDFDCILTDHHLPDGTGSELSALLREGGYRGPIIVLSGLATEKDLVLYEKCKIAGFFQKPFELQSLVTLLLKETSEQRSQACSP